jgi:hypothetical protein
LTKRIVGAAQGFELIEQKVWRIYHFERGFFPTLFIRDVFAQRFELRRTCAHAQALKRILRC